MNKQEIEKAIEYWKEFKDEIPELKKSHPDAGLDEQEEYVDMAMSALTQQLNNGWIPTSEKLPEEYGTYMVAWVPVGEKAEDVKKKTQTDITHYYEILEFDPDDEAKWIENIKQCDAYYIIAWQPLPEPYTEAL